MINYCHFKNIRKASGRLPFPSPYSSPLASSEENTTLIKSITSTKTLLPYSIKAPCRNCSANTCYLTSQKKKEHLHETRAAGKMSRCGWRTYTPQTALPAQKLLLHGLSTGPPQGCRRLKCPSSAGHVGCQKSSRSSFQEQHSPSYGRWALSGPHSHFASYRSVFFLREEMALFRQQLKTCYKCKWHSYQTLADFSLQLHNRSEAIPPSPTAPCLPHSHHPGAEHDHPGTTQLPPGHAPEPPEGTHPYPGRRGSPSPSCTG